MSKIPIYYKKESAGTLEKTEDDRYIFTYESSYMDSPSPSISLTLPKVTQKFESTDLFPFFDGLIPEGWLLNIASKELRLNPVRDRYELLRQLCHDTVGAIHIGERKHDAKEGFVKDKKISFQIRLRNMESASYAMKHVMKFIMCRACSRFLEKK